MEKKFILKDFLVITLLTSIWIHLGEVARAMLLIFPRMNAFFGDAIAIGPMGLGNMLVWGLWDTLLTAILVFLFWLCANSFGNNKKSVFISGTTATLATIGIFWIATVNTGLGEWSTAFVAIVVAWVELVIGAWIAAKLYSRKAN